MPAPARPSPPLAEAVMPKPFRDYLAAHGGKSLVWHAYDLLFAYFLTQHLQLPPQTMGLLTMALMLFGALADPVAGWLIGRGPDVPHRLVRLQAWGALVSALAFMALFSVPLPLSPVAHALGTGLVFQLCYKLYDVPQNALTSVLARDNREVLQLSAGRYFLGGGARILVAFAAYLLVGEPAASRSGGSVALFIALLCAPALLSAWRLARVIRKPVDEPADADVHGAIAPVRGGSFPRLPQGMAMLLLATFVNAGLLSVMGRMMPYLASRSGVLIAFSIGTLALLPLFQQLASRRGEHVAFLLAAGLSAVACIGLSHAFTLPGVAGDLGLNAFAFLYGGGSFGCTMLLWGTAANLIHRHHERTSVRADTFSYGIYTFASKLGIALSMLMLGQVLDPAVARSPAAVHGLALDRSAALAALGALLCTMAIYRTMRSLSGSHARRGRAAPGFRTLLQGSSGSSGSTFADSGEGRNGTSNGEVRLPSVPGR